MPQKITVQFGEEFLNNRPTSAWKRMEGMLESIRRKEYSLSYAGMTPGGMARVTVRDERGKVVLDRFPCMVGMETKALAGEKIVSIRPQNKGDGMLEIEYDFERFEPPAQDAPVETLDVNVGKDARFFGKE
jgi:hypothetical protein